LSIENVYLPCFRCQRYPVPVGTLYPNENSRSSFSERYGLTRRTYIGTTEPKPDAASRKGCSMLAKCRGLGGMDEDISGSTRRSICCGFRVQRYGPSYVPNQSAGAQGTNRWLHTRFKLSRRGSSITLKLANNLSALKVPHLRQPLDAVEQCVSPILGGRERGKAKRVVWPCSCDLSGARVPLFDGTVCGY
jgi:hypothetical protein